MRLCSARAVLVPALGGLYGLIHRVFWLPAGFAWPCCERGWDRPTSQDSLRDLPDATVQIAVAPQPPPVALGYIAPGPALVAAELHGVRSWHGPPSRRRRRRDSSPCHLAPSSFLRRVLVRRAGASSPCHLAPSSFLRRVAQATPGRCRRHRRVSLGVAVFLLYASRTPPTAALPAPPQGVAGCRCFLSCTPLPLLLFPLLSTPLFVNSHRETKGKNSDTQRHPGRKDRPAKGDTPQRQRHPAATPSDTQRHPG
jgi:hypothetical protein